MGPVKAIPSGNNPVLSSFDNILKAGTHGIEFELKGQKQ